MQIRTNFVTSDVGSENTMHTTRQTRQEYGPGSAEVARPPSKRKVVSSNLTRVRNFRISDLGSKSAVFTPNIFVRMITLEFERTKAELIRFISKLFPMQYARRLH